MAENKWGPPRFLNSKYPWSYGGMTGVTLGPLCSCRRYQLGLSVNQVRQWWHSVQSSSRQTHLTLQARHSQAISSGRVLRENAVAHHGDVTNCFGNTGWRRVKNGKNHTSDLPDQPRMPSSALGLWTIFGLGNHKLNRLIFPLESWLGCRSK